MLSPMLCPCSLANVNSRKEKAGKKVGGVACDLSLKTTVGELTLKSFFPDEVQFLKFKSLAWLADGNANPYLGVVPFEHAIVGGRGQVSSEMNQEQPLVFDEKVNLDSIRIKAKGEWLAEVSFRMQVHPTDEQITPLVLMQNLEVRITASHLQPPLQLPAVGDEENEEEEDDDSTETLADSIDKAAADRKNPGLVDELRSLEAEDAQAPPKRTPGQRQQPKKH